MDKIQIIAIIGILLFILLGVMVKAQVLQTSLNIINLKNIVDCNNCNWQLLNNTIYVWV